MLLARDPRFGHAYWELSPERIHRARAELAAPTRGFLRLVDIEYGDTPFTTEIPPERGRHVLHFPASDRRYGIEIGIETTTPQTPRAIVLLRSNVVQVPPALPRPPGDVLYVDLHAQREALARARDLLNPPRLAVDYPDPAGTRRPHRLAPRKLNGTTREAAPPGSETEDPAATNTTAADLPRALGGSSETRPTPPETETRR